MGLSLDDPKQHGANQAELRAPGYPRTAAWLKAPVMRPEVWIDRAAGRSDASLLSLAAITESDFPSSVDTRLAVS